MAKVTFLCSITIARPYGLVPKPSVANSYRPVGLPVLGLGYLLPEAGSPGGRPEMTISQFLEDFQQSITTQIGVQLVQQIH